MTLTAPAPIIECVPSVHYVSSKTPDHKDAYDALKFFRSYGMIPDQFQEDILKDWLAKNPANDKWLHQFSGLSVSRQSGKSFLLELRIIWGMIFEAEKILYTSHELRSAEAIYNRLVDFFDNERHPEIQSLVKRISRTNGKQFIELKSGAIVHFSSRSKSTARGMTFDTVIFDESQQLSEESYAAIQPTNSAVANPQTILAGTPPIPNTEAVIFGNFRTSALEKTGQSMSWTEFSADPGDDPTDETIWYRSIPGLTNGRISIDTVRGELGMFPEEVFMRERLGVWASATGSSVIPQDAWTGCAHDGSKIVSGHVLAVDISPNRSSATVGVAGLNKDDLIHVEVIDSRLGVSWVLDRIIEVSKRHNIQTVVIDAAGPASTLIEALQRSKIKVTTTNAQDMKNASGMFLDGVNEKTIVHVNQPPLNLSVANARKRTLGDGFAFARSTPSADLTPLVACNLAHWGVTTKRVKKSKDPNKTNNRKKAIVWR